MVLVLLRPSKGSRGFPAKNSPCVFIPVGSQGSFLGAGNDLIPGEEAAAGSEVLAQPGCGKRRSSVQEGRC